MKVSEALQILQSVHPDSEVTIRLGKVMPNPEPYSPVPMWTGPYTSPYVVSTPNQWPGTINCSSTGTMQ